MSTLLKVLPVFDFSEVSHDKDSEVHLDVILEAPEKTDSKRIPLHLILAIDCSGSMDGTKLASVKNTTEKLVDHLTENDTLGVIGFSDDIWDVFKALPMSDDNKKLVKDSVRALRTVGCTNISGALSLALERATISDESKVCRIILLTDGLPNQGITDKDKLIEMASKLSPNISLSTFGYGIDFDSELMTSMSNMGKGSSFYIKEDTDCNKAFAMELGGLLSLYGQNIKLTVTPSGNMAFKELLSDYKCEQKKGYRLMTSNKIEITLNDIFAGEKKHIVLKLAVPKATEAVCARATKVCGISVTYTNILTKETETVNIGGMISYVKPGKAQIEPNEEVRKQLLLIEAARFQREAQEKAEVGLFDEAQKILTQGRAFVDNNIQFIPNGTSIQQMYSNLSENYTNKYAYQTKGAKLGSSYLCAMSAGRGTSADTNFYANASQSVMMDAFEAAPSPSMLIGNISGTVITQGADIKGTTKASFTLKEKLGDAFFSDSYKE